MLLPSPSFQVYSLSFFFFFFFKLIQIDFLQFNSIGFLLFTCPFSNLIGLWMYLHHGTVFHIIYITYTFFPLSSPMGKISDPVPAHFHLFFLYLFVNSNLIHLLHTTFFLPYFSVFPLVSVFLIMSLSVCLFLFYLFCILISFLLLFLFSYLNLFSPFHCSEVYSLFICY